MYRKIYAAVCAALLSFQANAQFDLGKLEAAAKQMKQDIEMGASNAKRPTERTAPSLPGAPTTGAAAKPEESKSPSSADCLNVMVKTPRQSLEGTSERYARRQQFSDSHWSVEKTFCLNSENVKYSSPETLRNISLGRANIVALGKAISQFSSCEVEMEFFAEDNPNTAGMSDEDKKNFINWNLVCHNGKKPPYEVFGVAGVKDYRYKGFDVVNSVRVEMVSTSRPELVDINTEFAKAAIDKYGKNFESILGSKKNVVSLQWKMQDGLTATLVPGWVLSRKDTDNGMLLWLENDDYNNLTQKRGAERYLGEKREKMEAQKRLNQQFKPSAL